MPRRDHLGALAHQVEDRRDRGEPRRERQRPAALEVAERLLEGRPGRVAVAAVLHRPAGDVRRGHRQRLVQRVVRLVRRPAGGHRDGGGTVRRAGGRGSARGHVSSLGTTYRGRPVGTGRVGRTMSEHEQDDAVRTRKPRVAVVFGGRSSEHAISCATAGSVLRAIDPERYDVVPVGITREGRWVLESDDPERLAITSRDQLPEVDASRATVALAQQDSRSEIVVHEPARCRAPSARSTPSSRCCTGRSARTARCRGCWRWPASATSAPGCSRPRSAWTSTT